MSTISWTAGPKKTAFSAEALNPFRFVKLDSSGELVYADAYDPAYGILHDGVANDEYGSVCLPSAEGTFPAVAAGAIVANSPVYGAADGKVQASPSGRYRGIALTAASADGDQIEIMRVPASGLIHAAIASGTDHENTTTEAVLNGASVTIPANTLKVGNVIRVMLGVKVTDNNSTDTLQVWLRMGGVAGTIVAATAALDANDGDAAVIFCDIVIREIGASGKMAAAAIHGIGPLATGTARPYILGDTALDTTVAIELCATADWSVAHADNECNAEVFNVSIL